MIVVDTSVWIDFFRRIRTPQTIGLPTGSHDEEIIVGDLVLLEVLQGTRDHDHAARLERELRRFAVVPMMSPDAAAEAARIYRTLRADGVTVRKTVDLVIATFRLPSGYPLLQSDRDFEAIARRFPLRLI